MYIYIYITYLHIPSTCGPSVEAPPPPRAPLRLAPGPLAAGLGPFAAIPFLYMYIYIYIYIHIVVYRDICICGGFHFKPISVIILYVQA